MAKDSSQFGSFTAIIYLFNLVVGTGVLALPSVLISGGWLLGGIFITVVAFLSYVSLTFVVESMAATNAILLLDKEPVKAPSGNVSANAIQVSAADGIKQPLLKPSVADRDIFDINERTEFGEMAGMYYCRTGMMVFFSILIVFLYGDGVIYSTVVVRSLLSFVYGADEPVWAFSLFLCIFFIFILPFCFFDFQKTKVLQMITMVIRNVSLITILTLAFRAVMQNDHVVKEVTVPAARFGALPNLFGGAVYSFMCHHSIPGIITPIANKKSIMKLTGIVFGLIFVIYMALFIGCLLAFGADVLDPVTFNFPPKVYGFIGDALVLFPVFTLSSNFPMMLITLRNNLDTLFQLTYGASKSSQGEKGDLAWQRRIVLTLIAVVPPVACAFAAEHFGFSVDSLVGTSGAFAGCIIMFIFPATFVYFSRKAVKETIENSKAPMKFYSTTNPYSSPFKGTKWVVALLAWAVIAMIFNAVEKFASLYCL